MRTYALRSRIVSVVLVIVFVIASFNFSSVFASATTEIDNNMLSRDINVTDVDSTLDNSIPTNLITTDRIKEYGHIQRLSSGEDSLNSICLLNNDGTTSMYYFDHAVKYIDDSGVTRDKDVSIIESKIDNFLFENKSNNIKLMFPKNIINTPVSISFENYKIYMSLYEPYNCISSVYKSNDNIVIYNEAFGANTAVTYESGYDGLKENIILYSENAPTSFSFVIQCDNLVVQNINSVISFIDPNDNITIFTMDPFYVFDSSEQKNEYIIKEFNLEREKSNTYILTLKLDSDFLSRELVYPVFVDPSIKYNDTNYIEDAPIYSGKPNTNYSTALVSDLGNNSNGNGVGRLLLRFPCLKQAGSVFAGLSKDEFISAKLYLYNKAYGTSNSTISVYKYSGSPGWQENSVTWNNCSNGGFGTFQASANLSFSSSGYYSFDITNAVSSWVTSSQQATYSFSCGLIVRNQNENDSGNVKEIRLSNYSSSYTPYIVITYSCNIPDGTYFIKNVGTGRYMDLEGPYLDEGTPIQQWDYHGNNQSKWVINKQSDGYYTIKSLFSNKYVCVENNSSSANAAIRQYSSNSGLGARWTFSKSNSGNIIITAKSVGTNNIVLSVPLNANSNGTDLIQYTYTNNTNYRDEWRIQRDHKVSLNAFNESSSIIRNSYFAPVSNYINNSNNDCFYSISSDYYTSITKEQMLSYIEDSSIFTVHTHGKQSGFLLKKKIVLGIDLSTYLEMDDFNGIDLTGTKFILLLTCNTGDGGFTFNNITSGNCVNIVEKLVACGADCVIGFNHTTLVSECNNFAEDFYYLTIQQGYSVQNAISYMRISGNYNYALLDYIVRGYSNQYDVNVYLNN